MNFSKIAVVALFQILAIFLQEKYSVEAGVLRQIKTDKNERNLPTEDRILTSNIQMYYVMPKQTIYENLETVKNILWGRNVVQRERNITVTTAEINTKMPEVARSTYNSFNQPDINEASKRTKNAELQKFFINRNNQFNDSSTEDASDSTTRETLEINRNIIENIIMPEINHKQQREIHHRSFKRINRNPPQFMISSNIDSAYRENSATKVVTDSKSSVQTSHVENIVELQTIKDVFNMRSIPPEIQQLYPVKTNRMPSQLKRFDNDRTYREDNITEIPPDNKSNTPSNLIENTTENQIKKNLSNNRTSFVENDSEKDPPQNGTSSPYAGFNNNAENQPRNDLSNILTSSIENKIADNPSHYESSSLNFGLSENIDENRTERNFFNILTSPVENSFEDNLSSNGTLYPIADVAENATEENSSHRGASSRKGGLAENATDRNEASRKVDLVQNFAEYEKPSNKISRINNESILQNSLTENYIDKENEENKTFQFDSLKEIKTEIYHNLVQFMVENITSNNDTYIYINISKSELKSILPLFENKSLSIYNIGNKLIESGVYKSITYIGDHRHHSFCEWLVLCFKGHFLEVIVASVLALLVLLVILLLYCIKKKRVTLADKFAIDILSAGKEHKYKKIKKDTSPETKPVKRDHLTSEDFSERPMLKKQARKSIKMVDHMMSQGRKSKDEQPERRRLLDESSDESDEPKYEQRARKRTKRKSIRKLITKLPDKNDKKLKDKRERKQPERLYSSESDSDEEQDDDEEYKHEIEKKQKYPPKIQVLPDESEMEQNDRTYAKKKDQKYDEKLQTSTDESDKRKADEKHKPKMEKKLKHPEKLQFMTDESDIKREEKEKVKYSKRIETATRESEEEDLGDYPRVRRLSRWMQSVFKPTVPERTDEAAGGEKIERSSQKSTTASQRSSEEIDKTYTSKRQRLLTFLSPSRRKKFKTSGRKIQKHVAPPVRKIVSESDFSSEIILSAMDPNELKNRIVATGDCKKIDDMLVRPDWDRSFFTAHDIETIGERSEEFQHHDPEDRRKANTAKIVSSQSQVMGILSKGSSTHSLQKIIGRSIYKAEFATKSPRATSTYSLRNG